jgi:aspartate beta-hydroxylase
MNLAKAHRAAADDDSERAALEKVLAIDQLHLMANIRLAELHERRSEHGMATDHWTRVLALCGQIPNPSSELREMLGHAQAYVAERRQSLAEALDRSLASDLGRASERDRRRAKVAAEVLLGRRKIYSNQCHGFFYPFLPADEFFDRGHFPWLDQSAKNCRRSWRARSRALRLTSTCPRVCRTICGANSTSHQTGVRCICGGMARETKPSAIAHQGQQR